KTLIATPKPRTRRFGFSRSVSVLQQLVEEILRAGLTAFPNVELRLAHDVNAIVQSADKITVYARRDDGANLSFSTRYLLGCDGGKSTIRKLCGIKLIGSDTKDSWLVVDLIEDKTIPSTVKIYGNLTRPAVLIPLPRNYQRWEFRLFSHEDHNEIAGDRELVLRWISQWKELGEAKIVRQRVYQQSWKIAENFQEKRVFLLGDAAHLMPPFAGQGLCSGIRDAANICWKLAIVVQGKASEKILQTYEFERRPHIQTTMAGTKFAGFLFFPKSRVEEILRDSLLSIVNYIPPLKRRLDHDLVRPKPICDKGLLIKSRAAGFMFIQPPVLLDNGKKVLLDEVLGEGFALLGLNVDPVLYMNETTKNFWSNLRAKFVCVLSQHQSQPIDSSLLTIRDVSGEISRWFSQYTGNIVAIRPDRFIAFLSKQEEIDTITQLFSNLLLD
ncbi:MAG: FAD-dependent monooxygenase, partial [Acidobacteriota bacterium]